MSFMRKLSFKTKNKIDCENDNIDNVSKSTTTVFLNGTVNNENSLELSSKNVVETIPVNGETSSDEQCAEIVLQVSLRADLNSANNVTAEPLEMADPVLQSEGDK